MEEQLLHLLSTTWGYQSFRCDSQHDFCTAMLAGFRQWLAATVELHDMRA